MKKVLLSICILFIIIVLTVKFNEVPQADICVINGYKIGLNWSNYMWVKIAMIVFWLGYCYMPEKKK